MAWGRDVLAKEMRTGERRSELHEKIEAELLAQAPLLLQVEKDDTTDRHYHAVVALVTKVAGPMFTRQGGIPDWYEGQKELRLKLLAQRRELRLAQGVPAVLAAQINETNKKLKRVRHGEWDTRAAGLDEAISSAHHRRGMSAVHRYARLRAAKGIGVKNRDYRAAMTSRPTAAEWVDHMAQPGGLGACSLRISNRCPS